MSQSVILIIFTCFRSHRTDFHRPLTGIFCYRVETDIRLGLHMYPCILRLFEQPYVFRRIPAATRWYHPHPHPYHNIHPHHHIASSVLARLMHRELRGGPRIIGIIYLYCPHQSTPSTVILQREVRPGSHQQLHSCRHPGSRSAVALHSQHRCSTTITLRLDIEIRPRIDKQLRTSIILHPDSQ